MRNMTGFPPAWGSGLGLGLEHLAALVHAGLQVDVVRTAQFAGILVLDVSRLLERVGRPAHAAARRRGFSFRHSHGKRDPESHECRYEGGLIEDASRQAALRGLSPGMSEPAVRRSHAR